MDDDSTKHLQCTEVWGGNVSVDRSVAMPGLEAYVYSKPCNGDTGGGDVHYLSSCAGGQISRLLLADVSGHGNSVAQLARRLRQLMQRYVSAHTQRGLVRSINREFAGIATGGNFATAIVMTFDSKKNHLLLSNAGHPPPLLYRGRADQWSYLDRTAGESLRSEQSPADLPLGIEQVVEYGQREIKLEIGDAILCYTDWLPEARNAAGQMLGREGLLDLARGLNVSDLSRLVPALLAAVERWSGSTPSQDDITLLMFRANGLRPRLSTGKYLMTPLRAISAVVGSFLPSRPAHNPL